MKKVDWTTVGLVIAILAIIAAIVIPQILR